MGFFGRKPNSAKGGSLSTLTEAEIKKKLYGEFADTSRVAGGGDPVLGKRPPSVSVKVPAAESTPDLFEATCSPRHDSRDISVTSREIKITGPNEKVLPYRSSEPKTARSAEPSPVDPYEKYREFTRTQPKQRFDFFALVGSFFSQFAKIADKNRQSTRQVLTWGAGVLAVFLLFWGVNALNVKREQAMKTTYTAPAPAMRVNDRPEASPKDVLPAAAEISSSQNSEKVATPGPTPEVTERMFAIQVVTYPSEEYAERIVTSLEKAGFRAFFRENVRPTGATFYPVYIGGFKTAAEARKQLSKFKANDISKPFSDAFVRTLDVQ